MPSVVSALTARTQLGQILKRTAQKNERFVIDRRGEPVAVIMSIKDYVDTIAPAPKELRAMQQQAKRAGTSKLSMCQIDRIIAEVRRSQTAPKTSKRRAS
jgi:prevent-host-death family protein